MSTLLIFLLVVLVVLVVMLSMVAMAILVAMAIGIVRALFSPDYETRRSTEVDSDGNNVYKIGRYRKR